LLRSTASFVQTNPASPHTSISLKLKKLARGNGLLACFQKNVGAKSALSFADSGFPVGNLPLCFNHKGFERMTII
jgi:hypothetical protein